MAAELSVKIVMKRLPKLQSYEQAADSRFTMFTKNLWTGIYEDCPGYTVLLVPSYFDYVRLRAYFKSRNASVAMISEYTPSKECHRMRQKYECKELPVLMVTERALVFLKTEVRFVRNLVLYSLPESPDILAPDQCLGLSLMSADKSRGWDTIVKGRLNLIKMASGKEERAMSVDMKVKLSKEVIAEGKQVLTSRSVVGLFNQFDGLTLERFVGTLAHKDMLNSKLKDSFTIEEWHFPH